MIHIKEKDIIINSVELRARLMGANDPATMQLVKECEDDVRAEADCCYTFATTNLSVNDNNIYFDFGTVESYNLAKNLINCKKAFIVAVTLGHKIDRLLRKTAVNSTLTQFVTDAVASAFTEALCDKVQAEIAPNSRNRFSPGYCDLSLDVQRKLLQFLEKHEPTGICLTDSGLMIPTKSVTFILGVE